MPNVKISFEIALPRREGQIKELEISEEIFRRLLSSARSTLQRTKDSENASTWKGSGDQKVLDLINDFQWQNSRLI